MSNMLEVGSIVDGKVINVKPYGAFVSLGNNQKGLVHISHISNDFVKDINDFLRQGDDVKVKILSMDNEGKIALSLKEVDDQFKIVREEKKEDEQNDTIQLNHKSFASFQERDNSEEKKVKSFDELLKDYNKQANDRQVDINKRLKR